jgi:hypothetical protein
VQDLLGRERLADAQSHIVDLLSYLEASEGYSLFAGERKKCVTLPPRGGLADEHPDRTIRAKEETVRIQA